MKTNKFTDKSLARSLLAAALAAAFAAGAHTSALAQASSANATGGTSGTLAWAQALKGVYKTEAASSTSAANNQTMNKDAMSDPLCKQLIDARTKAAQDFMKNRIPPDPSKVIENSTCFIDVMDIAIPTSGYGFLDAVVGAISPFLKSSACNKQAGWWNDTQSKMASGQFAGLGSQFGSAITAVKQVQGASASAGSVQTYSGILSGALTRPTSPYAGTPGTLDTGGSYGGITLSPYSGGAARQMVNDSLGGSGASSQGSGGAAAPQSTLSSGVVALRSLLGLP